MFEFLFLSFLTFAATHASVPYPHGPSYVYLNCSTDTIAGSDFNLDTLLRRLSNATTDNGFNKTTVTGENPSDSVYGLFMCRADVPSQLCRQCVNKAAQQLALDCSDSQQALIWYDDCMLRYFNYSFFSALGTRPKFTVSSILNISNEESFMPLLFRTINNTPEEAASPSCNSSQEAIIWFSHCMLRYSNNQFFSNMEKSPMFQVLNVTATSSPFPGQDDFTNTLSTTLVSLAKAAGDSAEKYVTESSPLNDEQTLYTLGSVRRICPVKTVCAVSQT